MDKDSNALVDSKIEELKNEMEKQKELKFVNLMIEIIVSLTLKQLHEKSD